MGLPKEVVMEQVSEFFRKAVAKFAKREKKERQDIQLVLCLDENGENKYKLLVDYHPKSYLLLENIVGLIYYALVKDPVPASIKAALNNFANETGADDREMNIMLVTDEEEELHYYIYKGTHFIREATLEECVVMDEETSDE